MEGRRGQHTNFKQLGKCLKGDFVFFLPFFSELSSAHRIGSSVCRCSTPLCPHGHTRHTAPGHSPGRWYWVSEVHFQNGLLILLGAFWLCCSPHPCSAAVLLCWQGVYCCASRTGAVGHAFHPVAACWSNGADVCVCACSPPPSLYPVSCCNDSGVREVASSNA